jgi:hypothetical protein
MILSLKISLPLNPFHVGISPNNPISRDCPHLVSFLKIPQPLVPPLKILHHSCPLSKKIPLTLSPKILALNILSSRYSVLYFIVLQLKPSEAIDLLNY